MAGIQYLAQVGFQSVSSFQSTLHDGSFSQTSRQTSSLYSSASCSYSYDSGSLASPHGRYSSHHRQGSRTCRSSSSQGYLATQSALCLPHRSLLSSGKPLTSEFLGASLTDRRNSVSSTSSKVAPHSPASENLERSRIAGAAFAAATQSRPSTSANSSGNGAAASSSGASSNGAAANGALRSGSAAAGNGAAANSRAGGSAGGERGRDLVEQIKMRYQGDALKGQQGTRALPSVRAGNGSARGSAGAQSGASKPAADMQKRLGSTKSGINSVRNRPAASTRVPGAVATNADGVRRTAREAEDSFLANRLTADSAAGGGGAGAREELELELGFCNPFKKYTPERVRARALDSMDSASALLGRGVQIVWSLGLYWASLSWDCVSGRGEEMVPLRAQQLRDMLCQLGPSFIKAGQVLANRPDIIREDYMNELCVLQDDVPSFPNAIAFAIMEEEMGRPLEEVFSTISPRPIAAASLGQVYRAKLRDSGEEVAIKVQRPGIEPIIYQDLFLFRTLASFFNGISLRKLGCNAELIVDEFGEKLLEELDYTLEARNIEDFYENFRGDPTVKIPRVYKGLSGSRVLVMEWIDGIRCTDPQAIHDAGIDIQAFITMGVSAALRQLLEFGLFHGDPHPGNIFAMRDGRIAYVDFGNVAELSQFNKQILIDAIVHAVNEDYVEMAGDFTRLGFLAPGTDITPIVPALEAIWQNSSVKGLADFNFRTVTGKFNELVYEYPIRIPERFSLVIRSLLTQEGICLTLQPDFKFLEVAYPYVAKRLLTDPDPALRQRLIQILFNGGVFQWKRLENLIQLAKEQVAITNRSIRPAESDGPGRRPGGLDLSDTVRDGLRLLLLDTSLRKQLLMAFTEEDRLHVAELREVYKLLEQEVQPQALVRELIVDLPTVTRDFALSWSESVLAEA